MKNGLFELLLAVKVSYIIYNHILRSHYLSKQNIRVNNHLHLKKNYGWWVIFDNYRLYFIRQKRDLFLLLKML